MTGLYAASREALAEALDTNPTSTNRALAAWLIDTTEVVRVIDPDDDALVERLARVIDDALGRPHESARAVLRALVEDQP